jgi:hypothetical protein
MVAALVAGWLPGRAAAYVGALLVTATLAAPMAGLVLMAAAWAAAGALGSGHLVEIGPPALPVGLWGTALAGAGLLVGAVAARTLSRPAGARRN